MKLLYIKAFTGILVVCASMLSSAQVVLAAPSWQEIDSGLARFSDHASITRFTQELGVDPTSVAVSGDFMYMKAYKTLFRWNLKARTGAVLNPLKQDHQANGLRAVNGQILVLTQDTLEGANTLNSVDPGTGELKPLSGLAYGDATPYKISSQGNFVMANYFHEYTHHAVGIMDTRVSPMKEMAKLAFHDLDLDEKRAVGVNENDPSITILNPQTFRPVEKILMPEAFPFRPEVTLEGPYAFVKPGARTSSALDAPFFYAIDLVQHRYQTFKLGEIYINSGLGTSLESYNVPQFLPQFGKLVFSGGADGAGLGAMDTRGLASIGFPDGGRPWIKAPYVQIRE